MLAACRSDSYTSRSSPRQSEPTKLPKLPATRQKADANSRGKSAAAATPAGKKTVVAGTVTKSNRVVSRAASDSGSSASSYTSGSTSRTNTARSSKLPAIAAAKSSSPGRVSKSPDKSGKSPQSLSVQQQREVVRSNLQQTKAATCQEQARIKNTIQQQLQPGKMLF